MNHHHHRSRLQIKLTSIGRMTAEGEGSTGTAADPLLPQSTAKPDDPIRQEVTDGSAAPDPIRKEHADGSKTIPSLDESTPQAMPTNAANGGEDSSRTSPKASAPLQPGSTGQKPLSSDESSEPHFGGSDSPTSPVEEKQDVTEPSGSRQTVSLASHDKNMVVVTRAPRYWYRSKSEDNSNKEEKGKKNNSSDGAAIVTAKLRSF